MIERIIITIFLKFFQCHSSFFRMLHWNIPWLLKWVSCCVRNTKISSNSISTFPLRFTILMFEEKLSVGRMVINPSLENSKQSAIFTAFQGFPASAYAVRSIDTGPWQWLGLAPPAQGRIQIWTAAGLSLHCWGTTFHPKMLQVY